MGISSDGILFYGFCYADTDEHPWYVEDEDDEDDEGLIARIFGVPAPEGEYDRDKYRAYLAARKPVLEAAGVEVVLHCSYDYAMHGVAVSASLSRAYRGGPCEVSPEAQPEWDALLRTLFDKAGWDWPDDPPSWWLTSMYG
jgi:hypothetical protein